MTLAERIKQARIAAGITQEELARRCGTIKQTISKYERGVVYNLPLEKITDLAAALNVSPGYLMGWEESATPSENKACISPNRKALHDLAETATDEEINMLLRLAKAVLQEPEK